MQLDPNNRQGGKLYKQFKEKQEASFQEVNQEYLDDKDYEDFENLAEKLESFKTRFMDFDLDANGDIDLNGLKLMLEKLGQAKTHMEVVKMIREVDTSGSGTISYREFVDMMIGKKTSVLKLILMFEGIGKDDNKPTGPPPKKNIFDLP